MRRGRALPMKTARILSLGMLLAASLVCASPRALAQSRRDDSVASLSGEVLNEKGAPVARAHVLWQTADGGSPHAIRTDAEGRFRLARVRPGLYNLRATSGKKQSEWFLNVLVRPGGAARITLRLTPASAPEKQKASN